MAPWSSKDPPKDGHDLHTLLDADQRGDLTFLIASATASMRKSVNDTFDSAFTTKAPNPLPASKDNPNIDKSTLTKEQIETQQKHLERRKKELSEPKLQELKQAALDYFDDWRGSVIRRVGEVVNSKEEAEAQEKVAPAVPVEVPQKKLDDDKPDENVDTALQELYPPIKTSLADLDKDHRTLVLHSMLLLLLSLEHYSAHSRTLLLYTASSLNLSIKTLSEDEVKLSHGLVEVAKHMSADTEAHKRVEENKSSRAWKVGLASVAGAAIIGVTGGLAAPLVAAGVGTVMGGLGLGATAAAGYLGVLAESGIVVGSLFGAYGGRMTGKMMDEYAREVEDFAFLPVRGSRKHLFKAAKEAATEDRRLRVTIGISGWLTSPEEIVTPWRVIGPAAETFALRWEMEALLKLGNSMESLVKSAAWGYAKSEILRRTVFGALGEALWPIGLLKVSKIVDNPFSVAKARADKAGQVLADALINKAQGERAVTLIGFSLGARVIYSCLMSLASKRAFGLVESVILMGAPAPSEASDWRCIRSVVTGRVVNVFSENDYILGFLYRTSSIQYGVAGLEKIDDVKGIENVDVSKMISGHLRYRYLSGSILKKIGYEDVDLEEVAKEEETLKLVEQAEGLEEGKDVDPEEEEKRMEREVREKNEQTMMQKAAHKMHIT